MGHVTSIFPSNLAGKLKVFRSCDVNFPGKFNAETELVYRSRDVMSRDVNFPNKFSRNCTNGLTEKILRLGGVIKKTFYALLPSIHSCENAQALLLRKF